MTLHGSNTGLLEIVLLSEFICFNKCGVFTTPTSYVVFCGYIDK